jgi:hypothetical protein
MMKLRAFLGMRSVSSVLLALLLTTSCSGSSTPVLTPVAASTSAIRHVFVIVLENKNYSQTFGPNSPAPYLSGSLASQGALLSGYYGTGHVSLDNYISMLSGQSPTVDTDNDCVTYQDLTSTGLAAEGQVIGTGCVYPSSVQTLPDQMTAAHLTWKAYMGDMGNDPTRESATCGHPTLNSTDLTQTAEAPSAAVPNGDQYATRHDPFVYFHSIIDSPLCQTNVVNLNNNLAKDLGRESTTANLTFITPNLCDDGHDSPCVIDGNPGGLPRIDLFLQKWVPVILASPAYRQDGLLIINFDESNYATVIPPTGGVETIAFQGTPCCGEQPGPNLAPYPQTTSIAAGGITIDLVKENFGGDNTGAVLLSKFIKPGTVSTTPYNHYSMLKSIEDIFGLAHLGYAAQSGLVGFGKDVFTNEN